MIWTRLLLPYKLPLTSKFRTSSAEKRTFIFNSRVASRVYGLLCLHVHKGEVPGEVMSSRLLIKIYSRLQ